MLFFNLKLFSFLRVKRFCPKYFGHVGKQLDRKAKVNLKFMLSSAGKQIISIHILPNISRSKGIETMKYGYLIEHNVRN